MSIDDDLLRAIENLDRNISRIFGGGSGGSFRGSQPPSGGGGGGRSGVNYKAAAKAATDSLRVLKGTTDDLHRMLNRIVGFGATAEVFDLIVESGIHLTKSFSKMSDIGQSFGGSMFAMAQAAGASGLSLDDFTRALEKNSASSILMTTRQSGTVTAFAALQSEVRGNLKEFGFYGMTLSELTDASMDYIETLRLSGSLNKMNAKQQSSYVEDMIKAATGFSAAFGKSRQEIMKNSQEAMRNPLGLAALKSPEARKAAGKATEMFGSMGDGSMSKALMEVIGSPLGTADTKIPFVQMLNSLGRQDLLSQFGNMAEMVKSGKEVSPEMGVDFARQFTEAMDEQADQLRVLAQSPNAATAEAAKEALKAAQSLHGFTGNVEEAQKTIERYKAAIEKSKDPYTIAALTFQSEFHNIIGSFEEAFYGSFLKGITDASGGPGGVGETIESLKESLKTFGTSLGDFLSKVFTPKNVSSFIDGGLQFVNFISDVLPKAIDVLKEVLPPTIKIFKWIFDQISSVVVGVRDMIAKTFGLSNGTADLITAGIGFLLVKLLKNFGTFFGARFVNPIFTGGAGGGLGSLFGGGGAGGASGGGIGSGIGGFAKSMVGRGLIGLALGAVFDSILGEIPGLKGSGFEGIGKTVGVVAGLFGPALAGMLVQGIGSAIVAAIPAAVALLPAALPAALVLAILGLLKLGSDNEKDRQKAEKTALDRHETFDGRPLNPTMKTQDGYDAMGLSNNRDDFKTFDTPQLKLKHDEIQQELSEENKKLATTTGEEHISVLNDILRAISDLAEINKVQAALLRQGNDQTSKLGGVSQFEAGSNAF